ncbi:MAG: effector-binding domain-containing protein [Lentimonas sp.]|jgi:effector-binding domain-containing protein
MKILKIFTAFLFLSSNAFAYESAPYKVQKELSENIEIRAYENLILAQVKTSDHEDNSFRILFKFITGKNEGSQKIKMTTPVFQESNASQSTMSFVMPSKFKLSELPKPQNSKIKFSEVKNQKFIAIRFSGFRSEKNFSKNQNKLIEKIKEKNLKVDLEKPIRATYNAPWTLPFLKRNEVLFKIN